MDSRTRRPVKDSTAHRSLETFAVLCLGVIAVFKIYYHLVAAPMPDEAYYWLWGQHLDWSYFDHPPLQAWEQAAFSAMFGNSLFVLRLPALLSTLGIAAVVLWWAREARLAGHPVPPALALAVWFTSPVMFIFTTVVFPDHLAILLLSASTAMFFVVLDTVAWHGRLRVGLLYGAALLLGLAMLTKYNSALVGAALAVAIVAYPPFRPLLRSPHLYLAAVLSLACLLPVLWWNVVNDWASFQFHLSERLDERMEAWRIADNLWSFLANIVLGTSLFLVAAMVTMATRRASTTWLANWRVVALSTLLVPTLFWIGFSLATRPAGYWNVVAYVVFLPLAVLWFPRRWLVVAHLVWGMCLSAIHVVNYTVLPLSLVVGSPDAEAEGMYGWSEIVASIERQKAATGADFVVTSYYRTGAVVAFFTGDRHVEVISERHDQFDYWFDEQARAGQDAIVLTDDRHPLHDELESRFNSLETLEDVAVTRLGYPIRNYRIRLGRGYIPRS